MKRLLTLSLVGIMMVVTCWKCGNKGGNSGKIGKSDTSRVGCYFIGQAGLGWEVFLRVRTEVYDWRIKSDSVNASKEWVRVSQYLFPAVDSIRDKNGKVKPDSLKFNRVIPGKFQDVSKFIIYDSGLDIDSLVKNNPILRAQDSIIQLSKIKK